MRMELQVALDRLSLDDAVRITADVRPQADWVEVGTSLVKEFGMDSVRRVVAAADGTPVLADIKTNDNARYEFELAFDAGAAAATVMATAPDATLDTCRAVAGERGATMMIDLLGADDARQHAVTDRYTDGVLAVHVSKDVQESGSAPAQLVLPPWTSGRRVAVAGGVTLDEIPRLVELCEHLIVIVGSAITRADDPCTAARAFAQALRLGDTS